MTCCRRLTRDLGQNASVLIVFDQAPSIEQSIHDLTIEGGLGLDASPC